MEVLVLVPASERLPVLVTVSDENGVTKAEKEGESKDWIKVRTRI
jgi:hypothetical protein